MSLHPKIEAVTERIRQRSAPSRAAYLAGIDQAVRNGPNRTPLSCANLAHVFAACGDTDKGRLRGAATPNLGIITAYNDMLSAHQPYEHDPERIRALARSLGATAQVAGGVPAMCDGVTQGRGGMELSLFSRDVIAQATAVGLSHDAFDAALYLGICDKIVPGLLIGALAFGHLPALFVPAGPMPAGIPNKKKAEVRERYAAGEATREELLEVEAQSYHSAGTCTFYGTANSNQVLLEAMGVQLPGSSFINPGTPLGAVDAAWEEIDVLLVMSVNPGWAGQAFIPSSLEKLRRARARIDALPGDARPLLEVDGGIDAANAAQVTAAGADVLVSGSGIYGGDDSTEATRVLRAAAGKRRRR